MEDTPTVPADLHRSRLIVGAGALAVCVASVLAIAAAIECHTAAAVLARGTTWTPSLLYESVLWLWWAGVAYLLWQVGRVRPAIFRLSGTNLLLQIALATLATTLHLASLHWSTRLMAYIWSAWRRTGFGGLHFFELGRFTLDFVTYVLVWLACGIVYMQLAAQRHAFQSLELQQQLSTAKLHALQMQIQPHFLFNTLNGIMTLVRLGRQKEADMMLSHLNGILKATLSRSTPEKVTLAQELKTIDSYLAIEQTRFADRLRVEMKVDPTALDGLVPCFLLQPIVENAIRHGIGDRERDGLIQTSIARNGNQLQLSVRDNGSGLNGKVPLGHGIGLRNTRERLAHFYQDRYDLSAGEQQNGGWEVLITIPYEKARP